MSAIAGLIQLTGGSVEEGIVPAMVHRMQHRGRDASGVWSDEGVALGQATTFTTPESQHEAGPVVAGPFSLVADVRIDNRDDLLVQLEPTLRALGLLRADRPTTDPEVFLAAYARWGEDCPHHVLGDYAVAVWDQRYRTLFLARDAFGTRPLFYLHRPGSLLAFGSETKALRDLAGDELDEAFIADRILGYEGDPERTPILGVRALLGAHALVCGEGGKGDVRVWKHYHVRPDPTPGPMDDEAVADRFRELFSTAVRCRTRSAYPVGSDLSGGLDSSSVVAVARAILAEEGRGPLHTFSTVHDFVPELDERSYIQAVVDQGGVDSHLLFGNDLSSLPTLDEVAPTTDDDLLLGAQFLMWANLTSASENGVRTVLTGYDGDSVVSHGRSRLRELADAGDWAQFSAEAKALENRYSHATHRQGFEDVLASAGQIFLHYGLPALDALAERGPWWRYATSLRDAGRYARARPWPIAGRVWRRLLIPRVLLDSKGPLDRLRRQDAPSAPARAKALSPDFAASPVVQERMELAAAGQGLPTFETAAEEHLFGLERLTLGRTTGLFSLMAGARGVEVAHPFLDLRLVEFSAALPSDQKLRDGWTRYVQRRAMAPLLPDAIAWRVGKAFFAPALERVLYDLDAERTRSLLEQSDEAGQYLDLGVIGDLLEQGPEGADLDDQALLATAVTTLHWLRTRRSVRETAYPTDRNGSA